MLRNSIPTGDSHDDQPFQSMPRRSTLCDRWPRRQDVRQNKHRSRQPKLSNAELLGRCVAASLSWRRLFICGERQRPAMEAADPTVITTAVPALGAGSTIRLGGISSGLSPRPLRTLHLHLVRGIADALYTMSVSEADATVSLVAFGHPVESDVGLALI
jgi:hypothetical protein